MLPSLPCHSGFHNIIMGKKQAMKKRGGNDQVDNADYKVRSCIILLLANTSISHLSKELILLEKHYHKHNKDTGKQRKHAT